MHRKKQVVLHLLTIVALLMSIVGLIPVASIESAPAVQPRVQSTTTSAEPAEGFYPHLPPNGVNNKGEEGEIEGNPYERDLWFYSRRVAGDPNANFGMFQAAEKRLEAIAQLQTALNKPQAPSAFSGPWTNVGPNPMILTGRGDGSFDAMTGRIGALAIRSTPPYTLYLGGAQGGVWTMASPYTGTWTAKTDQLATPIGAIALAPSNEDIIYVGTGEGALSGDSYFGNGVLKSINGGNSFFKVSAGGYFTNVSISKIVVDSSNPNIVYAGTLRGRGGARRTSPPDAAPFGVWKSIDGGVNWTLMLTASVNPLAFAGVTDMAIDPQNSQVIYASLLGRGISKTVDGGVTWTTAMNGLPTNANYPAEPSRFAIGISHPSAVVSATLYTGFDWFDNSNTYHHSTVWKSTDEGANWAETNTAVVGGYCNQTPTSSNSQCFYDNVIEADPNTPNTVFVIGLYNYNTGSGGVYRSIDGGANWVDLGFNLHPDYHAIAIRKDNPAIVVIGNDGGVWWSPTRGGRLNVGDPLSATDWHNLNGLVDPNTAATLFRTNISLGQYTSIATNPAIPNRFYGGFQDNGTERKLTGNSTWLDVASGDGGQVLVDPTDANYFYGTYFGISPYRFTDGGGLYIGGFTSNQSIRGGINSTDRSEFYVPWIMDPANPNRLYFPTQRVYRTDNAKTPNAADVLWHAISGDLTSGCTGSASNGGRGCVVSALGKSAGNNALYAGTEEGWLWVTHDSLASAPVWNRIDISGTTPLRPVAGIAVDASNYRVAYVAFNGFNAATPGVPGHIFKTVNAGQAWVDISSNLPDIPVNSIVIDPADPNTLYIGTDIGPYVTANDGGSWTPLGTGFPIVAINQLALNPFTRQLVAGTHGRGAWVLTDAATQLPALQISKSAPDTPVGPGSMLEYSVTVQNYGNITATNVVITDPLPANTSFVTAGPGGALVGSDVVWNVASISAPRVYTTDLSLGVGLAPGSATVTFTVQITDTGIVTASSVITNDGYLVTSAQGASAAGSPFYVTLAPAHAVTASPASQADGTRSGQSLTYPMTIRNLGFNTDNFNLTTTSTAFTTTVWNEAGTTQITQTGNLGPGTTIKVLLKVAIPSATANGTTETDSLTATSANAPSAATTVSATTTAVTYDILLVDNDDNNPNVSGFYTASLQAAGYTQFDYWNLATAPAHVLPLNYLKAHKNVIWFTGGSYPAPIGAYEAELTQFLNGGGRLFMSGQDILDQAAGTTAFVHDYLHINWDGTETQNDIGTTSVTGLITSPVSSGIITLTVNNAAVGLADFNDQITPIFPAEPMFLDDVGQPDALQVDGGAYKVVFFAFPFEATGNAAQRANLIDRILKYLASNNSVTGVNLTGPATALPNLSYDFLASITPITATRPVRYYWEATDQSPLKQENLSSDTASFTWTTPGTKTITVTASNEEAPVSLSGINEVPAVNSTATGFAYFTYDRTTKMLSYDLSVSNIVSVTASHIHTGTLGVSGGIVFPLIAPVTGSSSGAVGPFSAAQEALLFSGGYYINVHTTAHSSGEIRGQIIFTGGSATTTFAVNVVSYGVALTPATVTQAGNPGQTITYTLHLTNTGSTTDTFDLTHTGNLWNVQLPVTQTMLGAGQATNVAVQVTIPMTASSGASDTVVVTATSQGDVSKVASSTLTTTASAVYGLLLTPATAAQAGNPGQVVTYTLRLTNTANTTDTFNLAYAGNVWNVQLPVTQTLLSAGQATNVAVRVTIPANASNGASDTVVVTATSQGDVGKSASSTLTTTAGAQYGLALFPATAAQTQYVGKVVIYTLQLTNTSTTTATFAISGTGNLWSVGLPASPVTLAAGASVPLNVTVTIPLTATNQMTDTVTIMVTALADPTKTANAVLTTTAKRYLIYTPIITKQ